MAKPLATAGLEARRGGDAAGAADWYSAPAAANNTAAPPTEVVAAATGLGGLSREQVVRETFARRGITTSFSDRQTSRSPGGGRADNEGGGGGGGRPPGSRRTLEVRRGSARAVQCGAAGPQGTPSKDNAERAKRSAGGRPTGSQGVPRLVADWRGRRSS